MAYNPSRYKEYYEANADRIKARRKTYYEANKILMLAKRKQYVERHKDDILAKGREYCEREAEAIRTRRLARYAANPGPKKLEAKIRRRRVRMNKPACVAWKEIAEVYAACPKDKVVDHIVPLKAKIDGVWVASGLHAPWNLQYLTQRENDSKNCRLI